MKFPPLCAPGSRSSMAGGAAAQPVERSAAVAAEQPAPAARSSFGGRMSIEAGLSRLSLGFTSALQRFGLR